MRSTVVVGAIRTILLGTEMLLHDVQGRPLTQLQLQRTGRAGARGVPLTLASTLFASLSSAHFQFIFVLVLLYPSPLAHHQTPSPKIPPSLLFPLSVPSPPSPPGLARALGDPLTSQSNPTYLLQTPSQSYVLRRAPLGPLLSPTAHRVDREYAILSSLNGYNDSLLPADREEHWIPVPRVFCLCMDEGVVGASFYVMEFLKGRIFTDVRLAQLDRTERREW
jgi:hypothetical protein